MDKIETSYLDTIFAAIPLMSDLEKGQLYEIAQEILRKKVEKAPGTTRAMCTLADDGHPERQDDASPN